jgi:phosphatidylglycerophosphate synthase
MLDTLINRAGSAPAVWLGNLARWFLDRGFSANRLTHLALATGVAAGMLFYFDHSWLAYAVLLISGLLDAVDGRVARLGPGPTPWGGVLDLTYDRIVEASVLLGVALPHPQRHVAALVLAATWYVNLCVFMAVGAASERHSEKLIHYPPGILERTEALIFALVVVAAPSFASAAMYVYAALGVLTACQRFSYGARQLRN